MSNKEVTIYIEVCRADVRLPEYARINDAGMDVRAACDISILPGETKLVPTGLKMAIPAGYEIQVRPRSGLSFKTHLRIPNSPGTIDSGYRDEICVIAHNSAPLGNMQDVINIKKGDRIAQFVLCEVPRIKFSEVDSVADIGLDRKGGFGSSGK